MPPMIGVWCLLLGKPCLLLMPLSFPFFLVFSQTDTEVEGPLLGLIFVSASQPASQQQMIADIILNQWEHTYTHTTSCYVWWKLKAEQPTMDGVVVVVVVVFNHVDIIRRQIIVIFEDAIITHKLCTYVLYII